MFSECPRTPRRTAALAGAALALAAGPLAVTTLAAAPVVGAQPASTVSARQAKPGSPGQPGTATQVWIETFENGLANGQLEKIRAYRGAQGTTYTVDDYWADSRKCNGLVVDGHTSDGAVAGAGCFEPAHYDRSFAVDLGGIQSATATPSDNDVLVEGTAASGGSATATLVARSTPIHAQNGHYLLVGLNHSAGCTLAPPRLSLALGYQSADHEVGNVDVCRDPAHPTLSTLLPYRLPADASSFQYVLKNTETSPAGNDFAVDDLKVLDVTPQLDQAFSRSTADVGEDVTLTYTITNVNGPLGLGAKTDFGFRDLLPDGLVLDEPRATRSTSKALTTTCGDGTVAESPSGTIRLKGGDLAAGQTACTVKVPVTARKAGTYHNDTVTVAGYGLLEPAAAKVRFVAPAAPPKPPASQHHFVAPDTGANDGGPTGGGDTAIGLTGWGVLVLVGASGGLLWRRRRSGS